MEWPSHHRGGFPFQTGSKWIVDDSLALWGWIWDGITLILWSPPPPCQSRIGHGSPGPNGWRHKDHVKLWLTAISTNSHHIIPASETLMVVLVDNKRPPCDVGLLKCCIEQLIGSRLKKQFNWSFTVNRANHAKKKHYSLQGEPKYLR